MYEAAVERREGINKAVGSDVQEVFKGKTVEQLVLRQVRRRWTGLFLIKFF